MDDVGSWVLGFRVWGFRADERTHGSSRHSLKLVAPSGLEGSRASTQRVCMYVCIGLECTGRTGATHAAMRACGCASHVRVRVVATGMSLCSSTPECARACVRFSFRGALVMMMMIKF